MKRLSRPWTETEDRRLLELIGKGKRRYIAAAMLSRSTSSVAGRLKVLRDGKAVPEEKVGPEENVGASPVAEV